MSSEFGVKLDLKQIENQNGIIGKQTEEQKELKEAILSKPTSRMITK